MFGYHIDLCIEFSAVSTFRAMIDNIGVYMFRYMFLFFILLSNASLAAEKRDTGFKLDVIVKGFFSPEVKQATVKSVRSGSIAESKGVKVGDQLLAVAGCEIPSCPASIAKEYISQPIGTIVNFQFKQPNGKSYSVDIELM